MWSLIIIRRVDCLYKDQIYESTWECKDGKSPQGLEGLSLLLDKLKYSHHSPTSLKIRYGCFSVVIFLLERCRAPFDVRLISFASIRDKKLRGIPIIEQKKTSQFSFGLFARFLLLFLLKESLRIRERENKPKRGSIALEKATSWRLGAAITH